SYIAPYEAMEPVAPVPTVRFPEDGRGVHTFTLPTAAEVSVTVDLGAVEAAPESTKVSVPALEAPSLKLRFHVIGGCFAQAENADKLLQQLQAEGHHAIRLPEYRGLHPVAFGSFAKREEALKALTDVRRDTA